MSNKVEQADLFTFSETGVDCKDADALTWQEWHSQIKRFFMIERSHQWHLGDLLNLGEARFGDKYHQVINDFGVDEQTIANWKWVSNKVAPAQRRKELTFQHHLNVAKLEPSDQEKWLEKALKGEWSAHELRSRVKVALDRARARALEADDEDREASGAAEDGRYRVILIDPDWKDVTLETLEAMEIPALPDSVVFMLCPPDKLRETITAFELWNFAFKSSAVIDLGKARKSDWFRQQHEVLCVGVRGEVREPSAERTAASIIRGKMKSGDRPEELYSIIEQMFPARGKTPTRLDLFGKTEREGWALWTPAEAEAAMK